MPHPPRIPSRVLISLLITYLLSPPTLKWNLNTEPDSNARKPRYSTPSPRRRRNSPRSTKICDDQASGRKSHRKVLGFRVQGLGFRVWAGLGFRVMLRFRAMSLLKLRFVCFCLTFRVEGLKGFRFKFITRIAVLQGPTELPVPW